MSNNVVLCFDTKLLGELLLDRHNFTVMTRYISNPENLKLMMNMLKDKSRNIQFEAFHVFKVRFSYRNFTFYFFKCLRQHTYITSIVVKGAIVLNNNIS